MIIFLPEAQAEYHEICRHYMRVSMRVALHFQRQFARTWDFIDENPQMYPIAEQPNTRRALLSKFPYAISYREISPSVCEITSIIHAKRSPGHRRADRVMEAAIPYAA